MRRAIAAKQSAGGIWLSYKEFASGSLNPRSERLKIKGAEEAGVTSLYVEVLTVPVLIEFRIPSFLFRKSVGAGIRVCSAGRSLAVPGAATGIERYGAGECDGRIDPSFQPGPEAGYATLLGQPGPRDD